MQIAIYSRKSVYTGKGESIENQVEMCRQYCLTRIPGAEGAAFSIYEDEGFSGKSLVRPQFQKMLSAARKGEIQWIVCYRLDRISRSVGDFAPLVEELIARNIGFISIKEQFDTGTPMGKAMMYIASVFAQLERETIAERVRDNMLYLARTGRWLGGTPPTGFRSCKRQEMILDGKSKTAFCLEWDPEEIETARQIFAIFSRTQSVSQTAAQLEQKKLFSRQGRPFSHQGIRQILQNPVYCTADPDSWAYFTQKEAQVCFDPEKIPPQKGLLAYNKRSSGGKSGSQSFAPSWWIIAAGKHRGMVSGREWVQVQKALDSGKKRIKSVHNDYALLSGLLRCGVCGSRMYPKARSASPGRFDYICQKKREQGASACGCQNLPGIQGDRAVWAALEPFLCRGDDFSRALKKEAALLGRASSYSQEDFFAWDAFLPPSRLLEDLPLGERRGLLGKILQQILWDGEELTLFVYSTDPA